MDNSRKKAVRMVAGWTGYTILVALFVAACGGMVYSLGYILPKELERLLVLEQWRHSTLLVFGGSAVIVLAVFAIRAVYFWAWNKREGK